MAYDDTSTLEPEVTAAPQQHDGHTITRYADGSMDIEGPSVIRGRIPQRGDFDENLAAQMDPSARRQLAGRLFEFARVDEDSRKDWAEREKRARVMLGIVDIAKPQEEESGNDVTHPMLMEATVRFQGNAITELFPPAGPAETKVLGMQTPAKMARSKRIRTFVNHYLTDVDGGYFNDTDKMLMYLPMGGSAFRRAGQDPTTGLPVLRHIKGTNFIAPYSGTDLESMPRYAWKYTATGEDIDRAMEIGMYVDLHLPQPSLGMVMHAPSADASDLREPILHDRDRLYEMLEYHIDLKVDADDKGAGQTGRLKHDSGLRPYIVVTDNTNQEVLMVRRNWKENDQQRKKRIWFAHHQFLPGLGFYGWGYPHVIGSLGLAASGAVNALLDAALAANYQGGFVTKEGKVAGEYRMEFGVWKQVDSSAEDLAKSFYTPPFKEPSPALFQLLTGLVEAGQRFAGTTDAAVGDGNNTGPVGTTIALIEQSQKPMSAIHKRLHESMSQELQMLCELVESFMPARYDYQIGDQDQFLLKTDFAPGVDVLCVTDPALNSDTQRIMRAQAVLDMQEKAPNLYPPQTQAAAHRRMLVALKVPNIEEIAPVVQQPKYLDAVGENMMLLAAKPVRVFPEQDDNAHVALHQDAMQRAAAMFPPDVFEKAIQPAFMSHIRDHMAQGYYKAIMRAAGLQPNFDQDGSPNGLTPQMEQRVTAQVQAKLAQIPPPKPKPGTPSFEQQQQQQELQQAQAAHQAQLDQKEQQFQAEERRKQTSFDNEERRKDLAMAFQEQRLTTAETTDLNRTAAGATLDAHIQHAGHVQDLTQDAQTHEQQLDHAQQQHEAGLDQQEQGHTQGLQHSDEDHEQASELAAKSAAAELERKGTAHRQTLRQTSDKHRQGIRQGDEKHAQSLDQDAATHEQGVEQSGESHEQGLEQSQASAEQAAEQADASHEQSLQQADQIAKQAAGEEGDADSHGAT